MKMETVYCKSIIKERNCEGRTCEFFIRACREKEISLVRGYGRVFTVIREEWREGGGRETRRGGGEVKGRIVAAAVAKGGEGWRGKRGRCSHTKKLKGNPTAIGSATQECIEFRQRSRFAIEYTCTCTHPLNIIVRREWKITCLYSALSCKAWER